MSNKSFRRDRSHKGFNDSDDGGFFPPPFMRQSNDRSYDARPSYDEQPRARSFGGDAGVEADATVKWYNPEKGFGFVEVANGSGDAFLHARALEAAGHSEVAPGTQLKVRVAPGQKGQQVTAVLEVGDAPAQAPRARFEPRQDRAPRQDRTPRGPAERKSGAVKWYNADKGFGFIEVDGGGRDVFVHASVVRRAGLEKLADGQRVEIDVVQGQKGLEASSITAY